jgi:hypothetical protein
MAITNTLTTEVLFDIALLAKNNNIDKIEQKEILDELLNSKEMQDSLYYFSAAHFEGRYDNFFLAVYRFLKDNNYLPEVPDEQPNKEEDFDSIALDYMMEERNW